MVLMNLPHGCRIQLALSAYNTMYVQVKANITVYLIDLKIIALMSKTLCTIFHIHSEFFMDQ